MAYSSMMPRQTISSLMGARIAVDTAATSTKMPVLESAIISEYSAMASGANISTRPSSPLTKNCAAMPTSKSAATVLARDAPLGAKSSRRCANDPGRMRRHHGKKTATAMS